MKERVEKWNEEKEKKLIATKEAIVHSGLAVLVLDVNLRLWTGIFFSFPIVLYYFLFCMYLYPSILLVTIAMRVPTTLVISILVAFM